MRVFNLFWIRRHKCNNVFGHVTTKTLLLDTAVFLLMGSHHCRTKDSYRQSHSLV